MHKCRRFNEKVWNIGENPAFSENAQNIGEVGPLCKLLYFIFLKKLLETNKAELIS